MIAELVKSGKVTNSGRAALGITATDVVAAAGNQGGVLVRQVQPGAPAEKAGIVAGDVITLIGGSPTPNLPALADLLASHRPSDAVKVDITRADGKKTLDVILGTLPG